MQKTLLRKLGAEDHPTGPRAVHGAILYHLTEYWFPEELYGLLSSLYLRGAGAVPDLHQELLDYRMSQVEKDNYLAGLDLSL
jgi:hypothetical protein